MPPKTGGGSRGRKKNVQQISTNNTPSTNNINSPAIDRNIEKTKNRFEIAPIIIESLNLSKIQLNNLIKTHLPEVKISNIQINRQKTFTLYPRDVKSFNSLLNDLTSIIQTNTNQQAIVYIPKLIQRILENNKEAFVKRIDLEINEEDIKLALVDQGFKVEKIIRLTNKEKEPLKTVKVTFTDSYNRDLFVKQGLQIDSMYFVSEPAKYSNKPCQCYKCFKFGHVAKYCKSEKQICSRCGESDHKYDHCPNINKSPVCSNCKGEHTATSTDCSKFKEYQLRIQKSIDQYSSASKIEKEIIHNRNWNDQEDYPTLKPTVKIEQIEKITEQIILGLEKAAQRILDKFNKKLQLLANQIGLEVEIDTEEESDEVNEGKDDTTKHIEQISAQEEVKEFNTKQNEKSVIGNKRKIISPSNPSQKSKTMNTNQK